MQAFHNDQAVKDKYIARVMAHRLADELIRGKRWDGTKGCAVGCTLNGYDHAAYETELGIPEWLAGVEDVLFEGMPVIDAMLWPERFLAVIKPGADLEKIKGPFLVFVLESALETFDHVKFPECERVINDVIALWKRDDATPKEFEAAEARAGAEVSRAAAAAKAAAAAAKAGEAKAAAAAAAAAAEAAAASRAARAAEWTAWAASWAAGAAREHEFLKFADKLVELLEGA